MGLNFAGIKFRGFRGFGAIREIKSLKKNLKSSIREIKSPRNFWKISDVKIVAKFAHLKAKMVLLLLIRTNVTVWQVFITVKSILLQYLGINYTIISSIREIKSSWIYWNRLSAKLNPSKNFKIPKIREIKSPRN